MKITVTNWVHDDWPPPEGSLWRGNQSNRIYICEGSGKNHITGRVSVAFKPMFLNLAPRLDVHKDAIGMYTRLSRVVIEEGDDCVMRELPDS